MSFAQYATGFVGGLADSLCSIATRDRIMKLVRYTASGFDLAADICSRARRIRAWFHR